MESSELSNCSVPPIGIFTYNVVEAGAALFSLTGCLAIFIHILIFKRYRDPAQRLLLYLIIAVTMNSINSVTRGAGYSLVGDTDFCIAVAFISSYTSGCIVVAICCIVVEMLIRILLERESGRPVQFLYFILIFILPILIFIIPFFGDLYGLSGATCWIKSVDENCTPIEMGVIEQYALWNGPILVTIVAWGILYIIALIVFRRRMKNYNELYTSQKGRLAAQKALEDIKQFRWYPPVVFVINIVPFLARISQLIGGLPLPLIIVLWIVTALIDGLQGMFIAAAFTLDSQTRKMLTWKNIHEVCILNWGCKETRNNYMNLAEQEQDGSNSRTEYSVSSEGIHKVHFAESLKR